MTQKNAVLIFAVDAWNHACQVLLVHGPLLIYCQRGNAVNRNTELNYTLLWISNTRIITCLVQCYCLLICAVRLELNVMPLDTQYLCCILQGFACSAVPHVQHRNTLLVACNCTKWRVVAANHNNSFKYLGLTTACFVPCIKCRRQADKLPEKSCYVQGVVFMKEKLLYRSCSI